MVASLAGVVIYALGALQPRQNAAIDESFSLRGARPPPAGIVIVAVDNYSLGRMNSQLPIPRSYPARLLDVLHKPIEQGELHGEVSGSLLVNPVLSVQPPSEPRGHLSMHVALQ